jgi:penicillin-binding protein 1C
VRRARAAAAWAAAALGLALAPPLALRVAAALSPADTAALSAGWSPSTRVYARGGELLREVAKASGERAYFAPLAAIAPVLRDAVLAAEDERFYRHGGVDYLAALRALAANALAGRRISGASTLTMQLARILYGHPRNLGGKLRQALDAARLEAALPKEGILELYLNRVPLGSGCEGVEAASLRLFGKPAAGLDLAEAALLAGAIQSPSLYDPAADATLARERRDWVLSRMLATGRVSAAERDAALERPIPLPRDAAPIRAGHFTDYALAASSRRGELSTTLDLGLQDTVEAMAQEHVRRYGEAGITNAAVLVLDNETGGVLCMVGSKLWGGGGDGFVNGALALRQPGSTLKPFAYALAFERGWTPASMLADVETEYVSSDRALYVPRNYSRTFRGPVLAKEALAGSLNIPAIRLVRELGVDGFLGALRDFGFASLDRGADYYGLGLVLGNGEVSLLELAGAYSALARGGEYLAPTPFPVGSPEARARAGGRAASYGSAWLVTSILSDEAMRVQAFGANSPLLVGFPMAIKTGTSGNWRDSWTVGYSSEFTIAVWAGDFGATAMNQVSGSAGAGPLFNAVARLMAERLGRMPSLPEAPPGARKVLLCAESGELPGPACPRRLSVSLLGEPPRGACRIHSFVRVDSRDGSLAEESSPELFVDRRVAYELPPEFAQWLKDSGKFSPPPRAAKKPARAQALAITRPRSGDVYIVEPGYDRRSQSIELAASAARALERVDWYVDGELVATAEWPYAASWRLARGAHAVVARSGAASSAPVSFEVR